MARGLLKVASLAALGVLSACGATGGGNAPVSQGPTTIVKGSTPAQLYSNISRQMRTCWFNPASPVLNKHVISAEAQAGSSGGGATRIAIHERSAGSQPGAKAFTVDFQPIPDGTQIVARNLRLSYVLGQSLASDVGYWAQGGANCNGPLPPAGNELRGSISGPVVTQ